MNNNNNNKTDKRKTCIFDIKKVDFFNCQTWSEDSQLRHNPFTIPQKCKTLFHQKEAFFLKYGNINWNLFIVNLHEQKMSIINIHSFLFKKTNKQTNKNTCQYAKKSKNKQTKQNKLPIHQNF